MKKIFLSCLFIFLAAMAFSQGAKATGLTDSDVESFCKNFNKLDSSFNKLGVDLSDKDGFSVGAKAVSKAQEILNKNGISGNNAVDKLYAIAYGYAVECFDETLANDPETAKIVKSMGADPIAEVRSMVSDSDKKVVHRHLKELKKVFGDE